MQRIAVISDVHSNLTALEAVFARIDAAGVDTTWCLGDVTGYGPDPLACQRMVEQRCSVILSGNHDQAVTGRIDVRDFNDAAQAGVAWSRSQLARPSTEAMARASRWEPEAMYGPIVLAHGSPAPFDPLWDYAFAQVPHEQILDELPEAALVLVGHYHYPLAGLVGEGGRSLGVVAMHAGERLLLDGLRAVINPGSVGQPRDGDPRACWGLLELEDDDIPVAFTWHRAPYDVLSVQRRIRQADLPRYLADRLATGR